MLRINSLIILFIHSLVRVHPKPSIPYPPYFSRKKGHQHFWNIMC